MRSKADETLVIVETLYSVIALRAQLSSAVKSNLLY